MYVIGTFVTMYGRIITTRFGSNLLPADGTGEQSNKLLRYLPFISITIVKETTFLTSDPVNFCTPELD